MTGAVGRLVIRNVFGRVIHVRFDRAAVLVVAGILARWRRLVRGLTAVHRTYSLVLHCRRVGDLLGWILGDVARRRVIYLSVGDLRYTVRLMNHTLWYLKLERMVNQQTGVNVIFGGSSIIQLGEIWHFTDFKQKGEVNIL